VDTTKTRLTRDRKITVRFREHEADVIEATADAVGERTATWIRSVILDAASRRQARMQQNGD
jgi:predicted DNA binding CopG/RHH family protein